MTENHDMKVKLIKLLQDIREINYVPNRRMPPKPTVLYLMQLRTHVAEASSSKRKLVIPVELTNGQDIHAMPVKITHV